MLTHFHLRTVHPARIVPLDHDHAVEGLGLHLMTGFVDDAGPLGAAVAGFVRARGHGDRQDEETDRAAGQEQLALHGRGSVDPGVAAMGANPLTGSDCSETVAPWESASVAIGGATRACCRAWATPA